MSFSTNLSVDMLVNDELNRQLKRIEDLIRDVKSKFEPDDELQSHMAKYICVISSGFLENAMYHTLNDIVKTETGSEILLSYTRAHLLKIQNPNSNKIKEIVKSFNQDWHNKLNTFMQQEERAAAVNYIITDRHNIAHGKDSAITINKIEGYLKKAVEIVIFIESKFVINA